MFVLSNKDVKRETKENQEKLVARLLLADLKVSVVPCGDEETLVKISATEERLRKEAHRIHFRSEIIIFFFFFFIFFN